jgi:hypothetical protein
MSNALNTGSTLTQNNGSNKTSTALSTNIIILVNNVPVGAVQSLNVSEARNIGMVNEIGTDGHIDSAPTGSTTVQGTCRRIRFDRLRIAEAFSRGFIHVRSQVYPFDIVILDKQKADSNSQISTVIKNVWIKDISTDYTADNWIITDSMSWVAETIFSVASSTSGTSGLPVAQGGERGIKHFGGGINGTGGINIEQLVDTGANARRGSMDAGGLIDIGDTGNLY